MLIAQIKDLTLFENLLGIVNKFVPQCQLVLSTSEVGIYCKNPSSFSSSRLLITSNLIVLNENQKYDKVKICIRDVMALKSAIAIVQQVENKNQIKIGLEDVVGADDEIIIKSIKYKSKNGSSFNLITIDFDVIKDFVSKESTTVLKKDWSFYIDPKNLDIIQNRTNAIVNMDEVSAYIYPKNEKVIFELTSRKSSSINSIALPVADSYEGGLDNFSQQAIAIHESSFRIFNILKVASSQDIFCFFNFDNNLFDVESKIQTGEFYVKSRLFIQMIKGK